MEIRRAFNYSLYSLRNTNGSQEMNKSVIIMVSLFLTACATNVKSPYDAVDEVMFTHLKQAAVFTDNRKYDQAIQEYYHCITLKPEKSALSTSKPRRWCQNNLVNLLINCDFVTNCKTKEALSLAQDLVEFNPLKDRDVAYSGTLAKAYAANGQYRKAFREIDRVIEFMGEDHQWREYYLNLRMQYRAKLDSRRR